MSKLKSSISKYVAPKLSKLPEMPKIGKTSILGVKTPSSKSIKTPDLSKFTKLNKPLKAKKLALLKVKVKKNVGY